MMMMRCDERRIDAYPSRCRPSLAMVIGVLMGIAAFNGVAGTLAIAAEDGVSVSNDSAMSVRAAETSGGDTTGDDAIAAGLDGLYRIGRWTRIGSARSDASARLGGDGDPLSSADDRRVVTRTRDGDGIAVDFISDGAGYAKPGLEASSIKVGTIASAEAEPEWRTAGRLPAIGSVTERPTAIKPTMPWVVVVGDPIGIDQIGIDVIRAEPAVAVSRMQRAADFPDRWIGYDGVDQIMIGSDGVDVIAALNRLQIRALVDHVHRGGDLFVHLGGDAGLQLASIAFVGELCGIESPARVRIDSAALETAVTSQTPLRNFDGVGLSDGGEVLISGRDDDRRRIPIAVRFRRGFGSVTVLAADLSAEPFVDWPDRLTLVHKLTDNVLTRPRASQTSARTTYDDLSGQLRSTLDRFAVKPSINFSILALVALGLIAVVGPVDYWLVNRVLDRPMAGWLTFLVVTLGTTAAMSWASRYDSSGPRVFSRRIELFDLDLVDRTGRWSTVENFYVHDAARMDLDVRPSADVNDWVSTNHDAAIVAAPWGHPGTAMGGILLTGDQGDAIGYRVDAVTPIADRTGDSDRTGDAKPAFAIGNVPLSPRSSKSFSFESQFNLNDDAVDVESTSRGDRRRAMRRQGSDLLRGAWSNPLDVDIYNGRLIYGNLVYLLPTRLPAGGRIAELDDLRQKSFRGLLSRQVIEENSSARQRFDPTDTDSVDRLVEIMTFHDAAGGSAYTSMNHDVASHWDTSGVLVADRCVLIGRVKTALSQMRVRIDDQPVTADDDQSFAYVRVVIPVVDSNAAMADADDRGPR